MNIAMSSFKIALKITNASPFPPTPLPPKKTLLKSGWIISAPN